MGKRGRSRFPAIIFLRNAGYTREIFLNIFYRFHFHNRFIMSSLGVIGIRDIQEFMKYVLRNIVQKFFSMASRSILSYYSGYWNRISSNMMLREVVQHSAMYPHISNKFSSIDNTQLNSPGMEGMNIAHSTFRYEYPVISIKGDLSWNNKFYNTYHKPVYSVSYGRIADWFLNHANYIQVINPQGYSLITSSVARHKSPVISVRGGSFKNNIFGHASSPKSVFILAGKGRADRLLNDININHIPKINSANVFSFENRKMFSDQGSLPITYPEPVKNKSYVEQANMQYILSRQNKGAYKYFLMNRLPVNIMQASLVQSPISQEIIRNISMSTGNRPASKYIYPVQNVHLQTWKNINPSENDHKNFFKFSKNFINNNGYTFPDSSKSLAGKKGTSFMIKNENYVFNKTSRINQEVEELKKTVIETKKILAEKPIPPPSKNSVKSNIDINRIADQVYLNIERRIRLERERKGI
ncbi:MAG TPA: hypothetical protein VIO58_13505 [Candidatus Methanoperedens sp.]